MLTVRSWAITVSGYPPVPATAIFRDGGCVGIVQGRNAPVPTILRLGADLSAARAGYTLAGTAPRCASCRRRVEVYDSGRVGIWNYCAACVDPLVRRCLRRHQRLPGAGEFFCPSCSAIVPLTERSGEQSRHRWRCRACRTEAARRSHGANRSHR